MTRLLLLIAMLPLVSTSLGHAQAERIDLRRSTITIRVFKSGLFRAFADDHLIEAPLAEAALDDSGTPQIRIVIDVRSMRVLDPGLSADTRRDVQSRMLGPDVLNGDRFPLVRFHSVTIRKVDADVWTVSGELELHGQTRSVAFSMVRGQGHYRGSTSLKQSEFGIVPISIAGGTVKVRDEVRIDFDVVTIAGSAGGLSRDQ
jgi:hypothetical protein